MALHLGSSHLAVNSFFSTSNLWMLPHFRKVVVMIMVLVIMITFRMTFMMTVLMMAVIKRRKKLKNYKVENGLSAGISKRF